MAPLFSDLFMLDERARPGSAAWNMALDEALLAESGHPVLRFYRWETAAVSFGYFLPCEAAMALGRGREIVRRWTGGGMVEHGEDFTWSLIVPSGESFSLTRPGESYVMVHAVLAEALGKAGVSVQQVPPTAPVPAGGLCFTAPAPGDLLLEGRKIAGAGQRRCRHGLLHQGSLCGIGLPEDFPRTLAECMAKNVYPFPLAQLPAAAAEELVRSRYGTDSWQQRR